MFILCPILVKDFTVNLHSPRNCINEETGQRGAAAIQSSYRPADVQQFASTHSPPCCSHTFERDRIPDQLPLCSFLRFKSILGETGIIHAPRNSRNGYDPGRGLLKC